MFQKNGRRGTLLALALWITLQSVSGPLAFAQHPYSAIGIGKGFTVSREESDPDNYRSVKSALRAWDNKPLGDRTPLVLIHGIGASASTDYNWENFLEFAEKQDDFLNKYKLYLYHYDSTRSVPLISRNLQQTLAGFIGALGGRKIKILAYSEGGLLTRNAMEDPYVDQHTEEVLTIATPFHGSPLANPEWLQQEMANESPFSLARMWQGLAYKIAGHRYPTFQQDFHWDNFDGAIPMEQFVKNNGKPSRTDYALAHKKNFITYGSYFGLSVDPEAVPDALELKAKLPRERVNITNLFRRNILFSVIRNNIGHLPLAPKLAHSTPDAQKPEPASAVSAEEAQAAEETKLVETVAMLPVADESASLESMPKLIPAVQNAKDIVLAPVEMPVDDAKAKEEVSLTQGSVLMAIADNPVSVNNAGRKPIVAPAKPVSMMVFNDGISPISSTLWLGRFTSTGNKGVSVSVDRLWHTLKTLKGNDNTRLFAGLDHRNWMDGTTRTGQLQVQDILNPDEPPRTVFEWIVYDLMS